MVASYSCEFGVSKAIVENRDTVTLIIAHRGRLTILIGNLPLFASQAQERYSEKHPDVLDELKTSRRTTLVWSSAINPNASRGAYLTRFAFILPSPKARMPLVMMPNTGYVIVPIWFLTLLILAYPFLILIRGPMRRRRRRLRNECIHCGYSLTGLIEPRCPECGGANVLQSGAAHSVQEPIPDATPDQREEYADSDSSDEQ